MRAEPAIANVPQERGPLLEIVPPTSTPLPGLPLNAIPHSPVVSPSRTVRALLSAFFALHKVSHALRAIKIRHWHVRFLSETNIRKKADGKKRRGRDWEAYRAGNLSPDLPGASVHHPWADRAGAPGHKVGALCRCWGDSLFFAFSLGLARSHLGSDGGWGRLGLATVFW